MQAIFAHSAPQSRLLKGARDCNRSFTCRTTCCAYHSTRPGEPVVFATARNVRFDMRSLRASTERTITVIERSQLTSDRELSNLSRLRTSHRERWGPGGEDSVIGGRMNEPVGRETCERSALPMKRAVRRADRNAVLSCPADFAGLSSAGKSQNVIPRDLCGTFDRSKVPKQYRIAIFA